MPPPIDLPSWLLDFDGTAGSFESSLGLFGVFLRYLLEDGLRCTINKILSFFEAKIGQGTNFFDDLNLLVACGSKNYVKLILFICACIAGTGRSMSRATPHARRRSSSRRSIGARARSNTTLAYICTNRR